MKIVAEYDIPDENVELNQWNESDTLERFNREEPFESVEDVLEAVAEALEDGNMTEDELFDTFSPILTWSVKNG